MSEYVVSARKYRPSTFESVVGQKALTETLRNAIRSGHLAHAYLFCGPRGVGKTTCARIFAKTINCLTPTAEHDACNECASCKAFNAQHSFNYHELDAASNNSVDDIRTLIQEVQIPPQDGKYSVFVIDEVHMLSQAAFNALLKTLEEPPAHAIFILATTEKHKVLPTILSRCQVYDFARITVRDIIAHLQYVARTEGFTAEESALAVVATKADGGMRDALSVFDQLVTYSTDLDGKVNITYEKTLAVLNVLDTEYYFRLVQQALASDTTAALLLLNEVLGKGFDANNFIIGLEQHLRDLLVAKDPQTVVLLETSETIRQEYLKQAAQCSAIWLFRALDICSAAEASYRVARQKRLTVELMLLKLCNILQPAPAEQTAPAPALHNTPQTPAPQPAAKPAMAAATTAAAVPATATPQTVSAPTQAAAPMPIPKMPGIPGVPGVPGVPSPAPVTAQPANTPATDQGKTTDEHVPFSEEQMANAWQQMCSSLFGDDIMLRTALSNTAIKKQDEITYLFPFPNKLIKEKADERKRKMTKFLAGKLHNSDIQLIFSVDETPREDIAYTSEERLQLLLRLNPELQQLRENLRLTLE